MPEQFDVAPPQVTPTAASILGTGLPAMAKPENPVVPPPPSAGPTPEEIASAKPVAPAPPTADEVAGAKPLNDAPPSPDEVASAKKVFESADVARTPVMDLANDKEFDPVQWAAQHPGEADKPEVLRSLREVYRQHNIRGVTFADIGEGALKTPAALGTLAKGVGTRAKNLWDIYLPFSSKQQGEKAAAESAAATESAAFGMGKMIKGGLQKLAHGEGLATGGVRTPWSQMNDSDLNNNFFQAVEEAKQGAAIASGQGEMMKHAAYSPEVLAKDGVQIDPANVEALSLTDPITLAAFEGGFKVVNAATGKVLAKAASMPGAQKAIAAVKSAAAATARQAVGQPMRAAGAAVSGAGKLAEKAGGAGLTVAALKAAEGEFKQAALIGGASVAAPALKATGRAITEAGEGLVSGAPLSTGVRRVVDLTGAAGGALKDIGTGAAVGLGTALATSQSPEETQQDIAMGGALAVPHAMKGALGHVVAGEMLAPVGQGPKGPMPYRPYGENSALDRTTADALAQLPPERQGQINFMRQLFQKLAPSKRIYAYPGGEAGKAIIMDAHASAGAPISPEAAEHAANQNGFTTQLRGPDGKMQDVVFLNTQSGDALGHEAFHLLEKSLPPETLAAMDKQTRGQFSDEEWEGLGRNYTSKLLQRPLAEGENWRDALAPTTPLAPDTAIARENRAENFDQLWHNRGVDIGTPEDAYRKIVGTIGRAAEAVGAPLVQGRTYLGHPIDLRSQKASDVALGGVLPKETPAKAPVVGRKPVVGIPNTPEAVQTAADNARAIAAAAPETPPVAGGKQSSREILGTVAEAIAKRTGIKINYLSAPDEPAAATTSNREVRRAMIEAYRTMPAASRSLWEKSFFPEQVMTTKGGGYQVQGWSPEVFAANAHKLAKTLNAIGDPALSPYELDPKTGSFSENGWRQLYDDAQKFVQNQMGGKTGAGESLVVPSDIQEKGFFKPPVKGPGQPLDQNRADVLNALFNFKLPETPRMQKGKTPLNIAGQEISAATQPGRVEYPVRPRGEFKGPEAAAQGIEGRPILEVNPFRNRLEAAAKAAGVAAPSFIEAIQKLNLDSIKDIQHAPEQPEFRGNTLTLTAGFQPSVPEIEAMSPEEWMKFTHETPGGLTKAATELGRNAKSEAEVQSWRDAADRSEKKFREAFTAKNYDTAMPEATRKQYFREAVEAADGTGGTVDYLRQSEPDYQPPFPKNVEGQAQPVRPPLADEPEAIKYHGAAIKDTATGRIYTGQTHYEAYDKRMRDLYPEINPDHPADKLPFDATEGFVTNGGEFLDRKAAFKRAQEYGQTGDRDFNPRPGELESTSFDYAQRTRLMEKNKLTDNYYKGEAQPVASPEVQKVAEDYSKDAGIAYRPATSYAALNPQTSKRLADFYDTAKHDPTNPEVEKSYDALSKETIAQYKAIKAAGYTLEPFKGEGEPYKNSAEMLADVRDNKHLFFLQTAKAGELGADNHLMKPSGVDDLPVNDVFRAVHDFFGHAKEGYQFGPRGELNAWKAHSGMYSDEAQGALAAETLAQNSWVNFGPHAGLPMAERPFGEQKNTVVPEALRNEAAGQAQPEVGQGQPVEAQPKKEHLLSPAVRVPSGNIYEGKTHEAAVDEADRQGEFDRGDGYRNFTRGYNTSEGRFVDANLARGIATNAGQMQKKNVKDVEAPWGGMGSEEFQRDRQFQPARRRQDDPAVFPKGRGFKKVWVAPDHEIFQLGPQLHHAFMDDNRELFKEYGVKDYAKFTGNDDDAARGMALQKGFARVNFSADNGQMTVDARAQDWNNLKDSVQRIVEANLNDIDRLRVNLLDPKAAYLVASKNAPLFNLDSHSEKIEAIPFMQEIPRVTVKATELPTFKAPGEAEEALPPAYQGPPKFSLFDSAGKYIGDLDKFQDAVDEAKRIGGSYKIVYRSTGQAQPFSNNAFDEEIQKMRSGESGGQTFNSDGTKWLPPVEKSDIVTLASVNMSPKDLTRDNIVKAVAPYADLLEDPNIKLGMFSFSKDGKPTVSMDINAVVPQKHRDNSFKFAKENDQVSFWDATKNEEVVTGGKGETRLKTPGEIEDALDDLLGGKPIDIPEILRQNRDEGAAPAEADMFGNKPVLSTQQASNMTKAQLAAHFPEAVIPRRRNAPISSDITGSPLYKEAGSEPAAVKAFSRKLVDFAKEHANNPDFEQGSKWYSEFVPMLKKEFGKDHQLMAELLAATSPQNAPESNFAYAVDALEGIKSGRFDKMRAKFDEGLKKIEDGSWLKWYNRELAAGNVVDPPQEPTTSAFLETWTNKHNLIPLQSNGKRYGISSGAVMRVIARKWLGGSGLKTQNFVKNLLGTGHGATIDLWADRTMRRVGYAGFKDRWRILPKNAQGVSDPDFMFSQKAFESAAKELGMTADALQGALWFAEKNLWADKGWSRLDLGDYRKEVPKIAALRAGVRERTTRTKAQAKQKAMETEELPLISARPVRE